MYGIRISDRPYIRRCRVVRNIFSDQRRPYHPRSRRRDDFLGATVVVRSHFDVDHCILVVYVCARGRTGMDISAFRFFAGLFDSSLRIDGAFISRGRARKS